MAAWKKASSKVAASVQIIHIICQLVGVASGLIASLIGRPAMPGSCWFGCDHHPVTPDGWSVCWEPLNDTHVHVPSQSFLYLLSPVEWYSVGLDVAGGGGVWLDCMFERGASHDRELLVGAGVEGGAAVVVQ